MITEKSTGKFIVVEGTEGVGKSTNIACIRNWLDAQGVDYIATREPGGTPLAEELRSILLAKRSEIVDPTAELLMMFAGRAQHLNTVIKPALDKGVWVLCDRFTDATYAYQGYGRGLDLTLINQLESIVQNSLRPDLTIYLDLDVKIGLERARQRGELDRFELEDIEFFERVRKGYLERIKLSPDSYKLIDAGQELDAVQRDLVQALEFYFMVE